MSAAPGSGASGDVVMLVLAVVMLVVFGLGWSGVLRDRVPDHLESAPLTWAPAAGFLILGIQLLRIPSGWAGPAFGAPALVLGLLFLLTVFWAPRWFGPSWYRERRRRRREGAADHAARRRRG